ncbi:MarR family winged helix-turn-helix transcriptional regulator [Vibrio salinus]|uniref:MarR family winged helix-turn-helix transcriptional regulator n=1 Tax=Vibrio salinus TaxID=2899784 RepID=UPI001E62C149|nr:MarR family transcriptional regulator [Vibrio salinus]MCE0494820.1 MarR family transcriptional regulator [Vibrio salinus]
MNSCNTETVNNKSDQPLLLENQVCFPLYSAANAVIRAYRPLLKELDLTYVQYLVMMVLWQDDGISVKKLGEKLHLDSGTLTPLLKRLEAKELLHRKRSEYDERIRVLLLTGKGQQLKENARSVPDSMVCKLQLNTKDLIALKELCEKVLTTLD